jgi:hypothetical protein
MTTTSTIQREFNTERTHQYANNEGRTVSNQARQAKTKMELLNGIQELYKGLFLVDLVEQIVVQNMSPILGS